ncbi:ABC transporter [Heterobasidion irregulare TC 32-1]|uniref:ABC transporter n=1 Tax=Heterobasidion irregulare (strain TC 32-1) TaxID=747525 RepID=W4KAX5_HETIT|nr:ABC transporter [Heterobasidion irregulare TC 32-1]ETW82987.1 ABC transporter [Heterobasidion irregulare TC 32-1]
MEEKKGNSAPTEPIHETTPQVHLAAGVQRARFRGHWWQLWLPKDPPSPAPLSFDEAKFIPLANASLLSQLTYAWITDIMVLGYQRTLQATDLWKLDESRQVHGLSEKLDQAWFRRMQEANEWNARLATGEINASLLKRSLWNARALASGRGRQKRRASLEAGWRESAGRKEASLAWALNDTFGWSFWVGGLFKVTGDVMQLMGPLLVKAIINFGKEALAAKDAGEKPPNIGRGVGMALGLFFLTALTSVCQHQFFWRSMTTGVLARGALTSSIYKRGVLFTPKSRTQFSNAEIVNHISSDLGPSALAGFSLFLFIAPLQQRVMAMQFRIRKESMKWTDRRARLLLEVLGAMRVVKYFTYETPFLQRIFDTRKNELKGVRKIQFARSANIAFAYSIPVLAASLSFITYTLTNNSFDPAVIFSSFSLFQLLRQPMMFLPRALSAITDANNALVRVAHLFHAETIPEAPIAVDTDQELGLHVENATFEWEEARAIEEDANGKDGKGHDGSDSSTETLPVQRRPFQVRSVSMDVPRGALIAVVGPVGSGKSSLLQGLIGEMRAVSGKVSFGGRVGYCPQTAWVQNATLRDNILFGQPFDEDKYWKVLEHSCLLPDLDVLPAGDMTEIGEKGINLSGGQKQRVNIARALYFDADIVLFDDPLSAVDAHVGRSLFINAILGALRGRGKTVILVTHALHFLPQCDYIYALNGGYVAEQGTYDELVSRGGEFARLDREFGGGGETDQQEGHGGNVDSSVDIAQLKRELAEKGDVKNGKLEGRLIVAETRETGSVPWRINWTYLMAGNGRVTGPLIILFMILMQGSQIMNSYTLVWWPANQFDRPSSFYQILYAGLGVSQTLFTLALGLSMDMLAFFVSQNLHSDALNKIFFAPMSFFDTRPLGRIVNVFGKDFDSIDNQLPVSMRLFAITLANVLGAIIIITILEHYFIIAAAAICVGYGYFAGFYRESARELKRLDAMLRSLLYAHFSESLTGLSTIRSYGELPRFIRDNKYYIDLENRALFLTVTNQRWLAIRLDFLGAIVVFVVALFAVVGVSALNAAQIGLVLTYTTTLTQLCSLLTRQSAEVENYMSAVERVVHYSEDDEVPREAAYEKTDTQAPSTWPSLGAVEFQNVVMSYRPGLPNVLRGVSLNVKGGEKIGVVGRTGAGKSSLMMALFRIVELNSGSISIDGIDISTLGLRQLRSKISIIPQEPLLFSGTVRSNLDPFSLYDDALLWDALRRSYLVTSSNYSSVENVSTGESTLACVSRIDLDTVIESEGANLSVGERSLLSLARALVKDSQVVVLDEATASVDLETDSKIQRTIQTQFHDRTLLCIAHRLRTIISYDRILVLNEGQVAEFDTPINLWAKEDSIFRGMCDRSNITLEEIERSGELFLADLVV